MKLHSPRFERELKREIKSSIRQSPALKREYRRVKLPWYQRRTNLNWFTRLATAFVLGLAANALQEFTGHAATAMALGGLYLLGALGFRIQQLANHLYTSPDLAALTILPTPPGRIFRWQLQKYYRNSLYLPIDLIALFGGIAWHHHFPIWKWAVVLLLVVTTWFYLISLAVFCLLRLPRWPFLAFSAALMLLAVILGISHSLWEPFARLLDESAPVLNVLLPTSWSLASFDLLLNSNDLWLAALLFPVALVIGNLKTWLNALKAGYGFRELVTPPAPDLIPAEALQPKSTPTPAESEPSRPLGPTAIEEIVASGSYLAQPAHALQRLPERTLWPWLTPREKGLAEFAHPNGMPIGAAWKRIYVTLLVTVVLTLATRGYNPAFASGALGLGAFLITCFALATLANPGRLFRPMPAGGVHVPLYASYGIGFREMTRFFLKHAIVQLPLLTSACLVLGALSGWCLDFPITFGLIFGIKATALLFAARFMLVLFAFSAGTNDTRQWRLTSVIILVGMAVFGLSFVALGTAAFFMPFSLPSFICWFAALAVATICYWSYGRFHRFGRLDLMTEPKNS